MVCPSCKAELPDDSCFCSACGVDVRPESAREVAERAKQEEALLATANLWRMRGKWEDAERCCVEVMRANPNSIHAHSLLGDIYRDQGRYDDAAQWYQLALDLDPNSLADRAKLDRVKDWMARDEARARRPERQSAAAGSTSPAVAAYAPSIWPRVLVGLSVVFVALVAVLLVAMSRPQPKRQARSSTPPSAPVPTAVASQPLNEPLPPPGGSSTPGPRTHPQDVDEAATPPSEREAAIERAISSRAGLSWSVLDASAVQPDDVTVFVMLSMTPPPTDSLDALRQIIRTEAFQTAAAALAADPNLTQAVVRIRTPDRSGRFTPAFQALLQRPADGSGATGDFTSVWWAPALRP